jgi:uncharacterized membrane protein YagU involved in acid resistance
VANNAGKELVFSIAAGMLGGMIGTQVMTKTMPKLTALQPKADQERQNELLRESSPMVLARKVASILNLDLTDAQLGKVATGIHWSYGLSWGGVLGALHRLAPSVTKPGAMPFGVGFWALADEIIPSLFKVAPKPTQLPASLHARDLAGHLVYTAAADAVFHLIGQVLGPQMGDKAATHAQ